MKLRLRSPSYVLDLYPVFNYERVPAKWKKNDSKNRLRNACQRTVSLFVLQLKTTDDFVEIKSNQDQRCLDF